MLIPHSLALADGGRQLYVADRENERILRFDTHTRAGVVFSKGKQLRGAVFAITLAHSGSGWPMYVVNGSMDGSKAVGFSVNSSGDVVATWSPAGVCLLSSWFLFLLSLASCL